jgi:hypothetical protein
MPDVDAQPVEVEIAAWTVTAAPIPPAILAMYRAHASLHEHFEEREDPDARGFLFASVSHAAEEWPGLVTPTRSPRESCGSM